MSRSDTLSLPFLLPAQAQKHVTHNEALELLDTFVQLVVLAFDAVTPPGGPAEGVSYALGGAPTGAWAGQAGHLATFTAGAWRFDLPRDGWRATEAATGASRVFLGGAWTVPPLEAATLGIGTSADASNPLAVAGPATLLTHDGAGHQLKINKAGLSDTGALLFQTNWSGRAEMGCMGNDAFSVKVSPDGAAWSTALIARPDGVETPALMLTPGTAPANPVAGMVYFDSTSARPRVYDGAAWQDLT